MQTVTPPLPVLIATGNTTQTNYLPLPTSAMLIAILIAIILAGLGYFFFKRLRY
jgi:hypothetical protein